MLPSYVLVKTVFTATMSGVSHHNYQLYTLLTISLQFSDKILGWIIDKIPVHINRGFKLASLATSEVPITLTAKDEWRKQLASKEKNERERIDSNKTRLRNHVRKGLW